MKLVLVLIAWMLADSCVSGQEGDLLCYNIFLFSNATLARCHSQYSRFSAGQELAENFCSECAQPTAQAYQDCGFANIALQIVTECAQDTLSRYCGEVIRNEMFLNNLSTVRMMCNGVNNCSGMCRTAIEQVGCCLHIAPNITDSGLPIDMCNLEGCIPQTIVNISTMSPQSCFSTAIASDSVLSQCYQDFIGAAAMAMGNDAPTREFCSGTVCPRMVSSAYATCGLSAHSVLVQKGCALDEMGRYCGNVVDPLITPPWQSMVSTATAVCTGTDCTNSTCQASISNLGCCIRFGVEVNGAQLPLGQCDVDYCPITFTLEGEGAAIAIQASPILLMIVSFLILCIY